MRNKTTRGVVFVASRVKTAPRVALWGKTTPEVVFRRPHVPKRRLPAHHAAFALEESHPNRACHALLHVLDLGVLQAVDVSALLPNGVPAIFFDTPVRVCLRGTGEVLFLNAAHASRTVERLPATSEGGSLCVDIPKPTGLKVAIVPVKMPII